MKWAAQKERPILFMRLSELRFDDLHRAVIVAVVSMRVMQMPVYEVIRVVAMRNCFMAKIGAVNVTFIVTSAIVAGGTGGRVGRGHSQNVLVHMIVVCVM